MKFIHITTGDTRGIGLEVALKALNQIGPLKDTQFVLWRSILAPQEMFHLLHNSFKRVTLKSSAKLYSHTQTKPDTLLDLALLEKPTQWVLQAGKFCLKNPHTEALVTGPLSKSQIQKEGFKERGHTGLLKNLSGARHVYMCFLGDFFNVTLLTGHTPLKEVGLREESLEHCVHLCLKLKNLLNLEKQVQPPFLGVLGFNPHAGEGGLIGTEESVLKKSINKWQGQVEGPLVPDTAFFKENWPRFFMYICMYHDQGLIPFKMIHGQKSFQLSLGLNFRRVSVSHGTAKDIYGQNKADPESIKRAILWASQGLAKKLHR